jgi:hypothetical protein
LPSLAVVAIQVKLRSFAGGAGTILWDVADRTAAYGSDGFTVFPRVVAVEILPVPVLVMVDDLWQLIHLELLVLRGMGIIEGPLLERDVSADKVDQPAVLLIKLMA